MSVDEHISSVLGDIARNVEKYRQEGRREAEASILAMVTAILENTEGDAGQEIYTNLVAGRWRLCPAQAGIEMRKRLDAAARKCGCDRCLDKLPRT